MQSNIIRVGKYKLSFSIASLAFADDNLLEANKKHTLQLLEEMLSKALPIITALIPKEDSAFDLSVLDQIVIDDLNLSSVFDVKTFSIFIWSLLYEHHPMDYEECLDGPLKRGRPQDWLIPLVKGMIKHQIADKDDDDPSEESEGNAKAR